MRQSTRTLPGARIGERVRDAHLSHFCPGGLGVPLTSQSSVGLELDQASFLRSGWPADHAAGPADAACARCGRPLAGGHDVRRNGGGDWVHESCPPAAR